jgi:hypothetical protein
MIYAALSIMFFLPPFDLVDRRARRGRRDLDRRRLYSRNDPDASRGESGRLGRDLEKSAQTSGSESDEQYEARLVASGKIEEQVISAGPLTTLQSHWT